MGEHQAYGNADPVVDLELLEQQAPVRADRVRRDAELFGDAGGGVATADPAGDLCLAFCEGQVIHDGFPIGCREQVGQPANADSGSLHMF